MKKILPHIFYLSIIGWFVLGAFDHKEPTLQAEQEESERQDVHWTFGQDYTKLKPVDSDQELQEFVSMVEKLVSKGKWDQFFDLIDKNGDFNTQFTDLGSSKVRMILNDLEVYGTCFGEICVQNELPKVPYGEEVRILDQISRLSLVGFDDSEDYGSNIVTMYGYIELGNRHIKAVTIMFRKTDQGYLITGPVG